MKNIIFVLFVLVSSPSFAGDYMLYIANDGNTSECAKATHWIVKTANEVSLSFNQYFSGQEPNIGILRSAFANGYFRFCGSAEINEVLSTLYGIKETGATANKSHLGDFISKIEAIR
jgi:hypothetical protein